MGAVAEFDSNRAAALQLLGELELAGAVTETSMTLPPDTTIDQWFAIGSFLGVIVRATPWLIGDWYAFGEAAFGTRAEGATIYGVNEDTISTYAWVARRIAPVERRIELKFSHHRLVAQLPKRERDRWLARAVSEGLDTRTLRARVAAASLGATSPPTSQGGDNGAVPRFTPREALTALKADDTWRAVANEALEVELLCPHCGEVVPLP